MLDYAAVYSELHQNPKRFQGYSIGEHVETIAELVKRHGAASLLDYGCGKGFQYLARRVHEPWGILPHCYDVGVGPLSVKPTGQFDGVLCCDMLEHVDEDDLSETLHDIFGFAKLFVFFGVSVVPSKKPPLPDGRNLHLTIQPPSWWTIRINRATPSGVETRIVFDHED